MKRLRKSTSGPGKTSLPSLRFLTALLVVLIWSGPLALALPARAETTAVAAEYEVKAVFLFNFAKFVSWPSLSFATAETPIIIGILGENPFGSILQKAIEGETVKSRKFVIKQLSPKDDLIGCHILFVSRTEADHVGAILEKTRGKPVLTVGEMDNFAQRGGIINFVLRGQTVRFEINAPAAECAGLEISSRLLNLPKAIRVGNPQ